MSNYPSNKITSRFAKNGNKKVPPATAALAGSGRASQLKGFKKINATPLGQGGIPPYREDFNGIFYLFSQFLLWYQQGGIMNYDATLDYEVNNEIYYNGTKYRCIQNNGVSSTVKAPTDTAYWEVINNFGDPVRYNTVQSLSVSQQLQARTNIGALGIGEFNTQGGVKFTTDSDYLQLLSTNDNILSKLPWQTIPNVYSRNKPVVTDILWSGDSDKGDITLSAPFTDYDALMCIYSTEDTSPGTPPWNFSVVPVWMMKKAIIDKNVFGVVPTTFDILNDHARSWEIVVADSTATFFKYNFDYHVHMWRIIGMRYTSSVNLQPV